MRRLLFAALLLLAPAAARADNLSLLTPWYGCTSTGCYTVTLVPAPVDPGSAPRYFYQLACSPAVVECGGVTESFTLVDASGVAVYSRSRATPGHTVDGTPTTGYLDLMRHDDINGTTREHVVLTTTPEPVTMALMGTGLVIIGAVRRRRRS